jgi:hypothetical protein
MAWHRLSINKQGRQTMSNTNNNEYFLQLDPPAKRSCDYQKTTTETIEKLTEILQRLRKENE